MKASPPEKAPRRIAVILGSSSSSRKLLEQLLPLIADGNGGDRDIEMQGVFLEEAEVQHAAETGALREGRQWRGGAALQGGIDVAYLPARGGAPVGGVALAVLNRIPTGHVDEHGGQAGVFLSR